MLPLMIQSPSLDLSLSFSLCYQSFIEYRPALSLTKREKHQHTRAKLKPFNDSRAAAICSCEYEQALFYLPHTRPIAGSLTLSDTWFEHRHFGTCITVCEYVPQCQWVWVRVSTNLIMESNSLSQERDSLTQSISRYLFVWSIDSWHLINQSINQSSPLRDTHTNRMLLGSDTRYLSQISDSSSTSSTTFTLSFDDDDLAVCPISL